MRNASRTTDPRWRGLRLVAVAALSITAPVGVGAAQDGGQPLAEVVLPQEFDAILRAYETGWAAHDEGALAELFSEDGFILRPGHPPVQGRDAIRRAYASSGGPLALRAYGYSVADSVGFIVGGFARHRDDPDLGKFLLALRRVAGRWHIAADMDNGN